MDEVFVHKSSVIDDGVQIGAGTKIWHFSHVLSGSTIGENCVFGQNTMIGPDVQIGDRCKIQNNTSLYKGVVLEADVFCGPSCVFTNVLTPRAFVERKDAFQETRVKKGATIGANATIVCGVTIGRFALLGAGALLRDDMPDYSLFVGNPARQKGWVCKCGVPLRSWQEGEAECASCGSSYRVSGSQIQVVKETL